MKNIEIQRIKVAYKNQCGSISEFMGIFSKIVKMFCEVTIVHKMHQDDAVKFFIK